MSAVPSTDDLNPGALAASSENPKLVLSRAAVAAIVTGNAMEFYDFVTYTFFAIYIGPAFFPSDSAYLSLFYANLVFWVGFLARPVGGFVIGAIGDRAGRKPAMMLTIGFITLGTLGLAITPSYATIGPLAPVIIVLCRLLQGLALGGEVGPSTALLIEGAPRGKIGLFSSWQLGGQGMASMAAGIIGVVLALVLTTEQLKNWGFRLPFAIGLLVLPIAIYIRGRLPETIKSDEKEGTTRELFKAVFIKHYGIVILSILTIAGATVSTYMNTYMTTYAINTLHLPAAVGLAAAIMAGFSTLVGALFGGYLSDRLGRKQLMIVPRIGTLILIYPAFLVLLAYPTLITLLAVVGLLGVLTAMSGTAVITVIPEVVPKAYRCTVIAVSYAVGVMIFGGTTPLAITWILKETDNPLSPAFYVMVASVLSLVAMYLMPDPKNLNPDPAA